MEVKKWKSRHLQWRLFLFEGLRPGPVWFPGSRQISIVSLSALIFEAIFALFNLSRPSVTKIEFQLNGFLQR